MQTTSQPSVLTPASILAPSKVNWLHVGWFLGLTFGLTWLTDLVLYLNGGLTSPVATLLMQFRMLLPAFSGMLLGVFFFKESRLYHRSNRTASRWFVYYFFLLTFLYLIGAIASLIRPQQAAILSSILLIPNLIGLILLVVLRLRKGGREAFASTGLAGGKWQIWFLYGLGLIVFYGLQTSLNVVFKLGPLTDLKAISPQMAAAMPNWALILLMAFQMMVILPFLGLIISFGEEYGWRGYLQTELIRLGRIRGVFFVGVIWGIWHWPIIWMGYNYPGQPALGSIAMVVFCVLLGYFLSYAVFKSNGIWTAAYLHALNNQVLAFFLLAIMVPTNMLTSFGIGIPTLVLAAIIILLILRDPIWKVTEPSQG